MDKATALDKDWCTPLEKTLDLEHSKGDLSILSSFVMVPPPQLQHASFASCR